MIELLKEIWTTVQRNKLRTSLTGFAVAWGIFMLIFLLGAGNGLINANMDQMNRFLTNSMMVFGGRTSKPYNGLKEGRRIELDNKDMHTTATSFKENVLE
ncbi:MAG: ABC transporter permease, partial [Prevotella sp.]|nr:ABC transporter permease [Prevotella sp.]